MVRFRQGLGGILAIVVVGLAGAAMVVLIDHGPRRFLLEFVLALLIAFGGLVLLSYLADRR